jgi:hypothetical protein
MNAEYSAAATNLNLTSDLCAFLANLAFDDLPCHAVHQARRGQHHVWTPPVLHGKSDLKRR